MTQHILQTLGGLGMFLLAMLVMTEGLRGLTTRLADPLYPQGEHASRYLVQYAG